MSWLTKDFICPGCGAVEEVFLEHDDFAQCQCGERMTRILSRGADQRSFKEGWYEHIDIKPMYITSKKQLKRECEARGIYSEYADS